MDDRIAGLARERYISLTTYRRDGRAVATAVWFALDGETIVVWTDKASGKARRVRANGRASVAPCDVRGKVTGPAFEAHARMLPDEDFARANRLLSAKYSLQKPLIDLWMRITYALRRKQLPVEACMAVRPADSPPPST